MTFIYIALGGALGAVSRHFSVVYVNSLVNKAFPYGTAFVNIVGSLLIGFLAHIILTLEWNNSIKLFVITGFLGGFTTFSSFSLDTISLFTQGMYLKACLNVVLNVGTCLAMTVIGVSLAKLALGK